MDRIDSMQVKIAELTGAGDMLLKREILCHISDTKKKLLTICEGGCLTMEEEPNMKLQSLVR